MSRWGSGRLGRRWRSRRAVSEIVSALLLVAIVVTAGVFVLAFARGGLGGLSGSFSGLISSQGSAAAERFVVEQASFNFSGAPTGADLYVRNVGTVPIILVSVYVVDQSTNAFVTQVAINKAVGVGVLASIPRTTLSFTPSRGSAYSFTVTSSLGNSVTLDVRAT
jgi:flagellin-like protein